MGPVLYSLGIILLLLGLFGVVFFQNEERKRQYASYGNISMWLIGIGITLLIVGIFVAGTLF